MDNTLPLLVEDLSFRYRDRQELAIADISLRLDPGEILLVAPRSYKGERGGEILLSGQDTTSMSLARISQFVGTVLQDPERQILGTKVINEVAFGLENKGIQRAEILARAESAMHRLRIIHLRDRETFNLSGGEKQKVALAGVLAMEPRVLMLDEPLASLDPASAQEALSMIRNLADEGMAVLIIEHRVEDVLSIHPDRMIFMQDGRIRYDGPTAEMDQAVDQKQVKLPARIVMQRAAAEPPQPFIEPKLKPSKIHQDPLVRFDDVGFGYEGGPEVLHAISMEIHAGDIVAVLGPNGAGKTTLVKQAIGLLKPTSGSVSVGGRDSSEMSVAQVATSLGYVFQSPSHMLFAPSVREELRFGPKNLGYSDDVIEEEVQKAIDTMNLSGMEDDSPLALSFGQQKRVSIAAVLSMRSKILVMDEPTAGQDYRNYMDFMDTILQLPYFEAILFITHDLDLAVVYANRVLLMSEGTLIADGPPQEVLVDYERLQQCRVKPTSLLDLNLETFERTGRFLRAEALAHALS